MARALRFSKPDVSLRPDMLAMSPEFNSLAIKKPNGWVAYSVADSDSGIGVKA